MSGSTLVDSNEICVRGTCAGGTESASSQAPAIARNGDNAGKAYLAENDDGRSRPSKWTLQRAAQRLLPLDRVAQCNHTMAKGAEYVTVRRDSNSAWFTGIVHCGSVWACPVCARKIGEVRREKMQLAIDTAIGRGGGVALLTFTFSHALYHRIDDLLPRLARAMRYLKGGRQFQELKKKYGIYGNVRALEVTRGNNGWHPHVHEIEFFDKPLSDADHEALREELFLIWKSACQKAGLQLPTREHGVDVRRASHAAQYVGKWGFASEVTRPSSKRGWSGRTPWQLLEDYHNGDELAGKLFVEFYEAFKGRRQLYWSKGLNKILDLPEDLSDEAQAELELAREEDKPIDVVQIAPGMWAYLCSIPRARETLLQLVMSCEHYDEVRGWLERLHRTIPDRVHHDDGSMTSYERFKQYAPYRDAIGENYA